MYILRCSDGSYYTGVTNNIVRRLAEHKNGKHVGSYTFTRRPVELIYYEFYQYILNAIRREKQLKKWSRKKKEALMRKDWKELRRLARGK